jgi:hypothetical protein
MGEQRLEMGPACCASSITTSSGLRWLILSHDATASRKRNRSRRRPKDGRSERRDHRGQLGAEPDKRTGVGTQILLQRRRLLVRVNLERIGESAERASESASRQRPHATCTPLAVALPRSCQA